MTAACEHDWREYWDGSLGYRATDCCVTCGAYRPALGATLARVRALAEAPIPQPPAFAEDHWTRGEIESWEEGALRFKALLCEALNPGGGQ